jgi:hypothetical protein
METNGNTPNGTTQNRLLWWAIASIFGPMMLALTGTMLNLTISNAQRLSTLEAQYQDLNRALSDINRKLDRVLDRQKP